VPEPSGAPALENDQRYAQWIDAGYAGEMDYLKREDDAGEYLRGDLRRSMPWARSVIVCAVNYNAAAPKSIDPADAKAGWIARYAWSGHEESSAGSDYHDVLLHQLRALESELKERFGADASARCYVDTGPLVERDYAERAGLGWIGKNTCVLNQQQGSWLLLGVIVTSLELEPEAWSVPAADRCGSCTRCIDACPTDALLDPDVTGIRQMDAARCIAYLTIEKKGSIAEELRPLMGRQVFGCDICQDVCPWNRKAPISVDTELEPRAELVNPALEALAAMDEPEFERVFNGSPVRRAGFAGLRRNIAIAMGNSGVRESAPRLREWAGAADKGLRAAAQWALKKFNL
jgi:epoxyqueuosine reductase